MMNLIVANHDNLEKLDALRKQLQQQNNQKVTEWRPSASQPNESPMARRTAKGKSLTSHQSQQIRVPGAQSALRTRASNPQRTRTGHRQLSQYGADKLATHSLIVYQLSDNDYRREVPTHEELVDRLTNPNNKHFTRNPVILNNQVVK